MNNQWQNFCGLLIDVIDYSLMLLISHWLVIFYYDAQCSFTAYYEFPVFVFIITTFPSTNLHPEQWYKTSIYHEELVCFRCNHEIPPISHQCHWWVISAWNFVAYWLVIDYSLIFSNNQWLINRLISIEYSLMLLISLISYPGTLIALKGPCEQDFAKTNRGFNKYWSRRQTLLQYAAATLQGP